MGNDRGSNVRITLLDLIELMTEPGDFRLSDKWHREMDGGEVTVVHWIVNPAVFRHDRGDLFLPGASRSNTVNGDDDLALWSQHIRSSTFTVELGCYNKLQNPNSKHQINTKFQIPRKFQSVKLHTILPAWPFAFVQQRSLLVLHKPRLQILRGLRSLGFEVWSFFGVWSLEFGVSGSTVLP